jgi:hypothetical protein
VQFGSVVAEIVDAKNRPPRNWRHSGRTGKLRSVLTMFSWGSPCFTTSLFGTLQALTGHNGLTPDMHILNNIQPMIQQLATQQRHWIQILIRPDTHVAQENGKATRGCGAEIRRSHLRSLKLVLDALRVPAARPGTRPFRAEHVTGRARSGGHRGASHLLKLQGPRTLRNLPPSLLRCHFGINQSKIDILSIL